jgi:hypothetical protein
MVDTRGVFSVRLINKINARGGWVNLDDVWIPVPVPNTGYFGGGFVPSVPGAVSRMDKVTYATDTTAFTPGANLSVARYFSAATGSSSAGYFGGGNPAPGGTAVSTMDKVIYATDTTAATPGANLSGARWELAATGNSISGYFGCCNISKFFQLSTVQLLIITHLIF